MKTALRLLAPAAFSAASVFALTLGEIEAVALENNPTLKQAEAAVLRVDGLRSQAGLYPNPTVGATGEELSNEPALRGGEVGFFVEQRIVTAGKLSKARAVLDFENQQAHASRAAQRYRVLNSVRAFFYQALSAQRLVRIREQLEALAYEGADVTNRLANVGQADAPDVLQAEIEAQQAALAAVRARMELDKLWTQLAVVAGRPEMAYEPLTGETENFPRLERDSALQLLLARSPQLSLAEAGVERARALVARERAVPVPDIEVHGGLRHNPALSLTGAGSIGMEGFFDVGVQVPIFNRNQGQIKAARAHLMHAEGELDRMRLSLRARLAVAYQDYAVAVRTADRFHNEILPRARRAEALYLENIGKMAAAYPQLLIARRNRLQLEHDYVTALASAWAGAIEIEGMLLAGALDNPLSVGDEAGSRARHGGASGAEQHDF